MEEITFSGLRYVPEMRYPDTDKPEILFYVSGKRGVCVRQGQKSGDFDACCACECGGRVVMPISGSKKI